MVVIRDNKFLTVKYVNSDFGSRRVNMYNARIEYFSTFNVYNFTGSEVFDIVLG